MGATITTIDELPKLKKISRKMKQLQKKLLNGSTMPPEEIKRYEKMYPWLKNV